MSGPAWHTFTMKFFTVSRKMACCIWQMLFICFVYTMSSFHVWQRPFTPSQKAGTTILYGLKVDSPQTSSGFWATWRTLVTRMKICRFVEAQTRGAVYKGEVQLTGFEPEYVEVRYTIDFFIVIWMGSISSTVWKEYEVKIQEQVL